MLSKLRKHGATIAAIAATATIMVTLPALAGTGIGASLTLGKTNSVDATTALTGKASGGMLKITNNGTGPALSLNVKSGKPPLAVNSPAKVAKLNADLLDGLDSAGFVPTSLLSKFAVNMSDGNTDKTLKQIGPFTFKGRCYTSGSHNATLKISTTEDHSAFAVDTGSSVNLVDADLLTSESPEILGASTSTNPAVVHGQVNALSPSGWDVSVDLWIYRALGNHDCRFDGYSLTLATP